MPNYFQKLSGLVRKAIMQYDMIQENDKIAVAVSGGKDSVLLALSLNQVRRYLGINFDIIAITIDPRFSKDDTDFSIIENLFKEHNIEYHIKRSDIGTIIFDERKEANPCSLCARMRRGALHDLTLELGCNKIALGHHLDDAIETFYMNLWNEGRIGTFSPLTYLSIKDITMIRPFALACESDVIRAQKQLNIPIVKSECKVDGITNRQNMKEFVNQKSKEDPFFRRKSLTAFQNKNLDGWGIKKDK